MFRNRIAKAAAGVMAAAVLLAGCGGIDKTATLVTINGGEDTITLGYGNFAARTAQAQYDLVYRMFYGDSYWSQAVGEGTMETMVKEDVLTAIEDQYLLRQHAADYGVSLNEEQTDAIDSAVAEFIADNTKEGLAQLGATEDLVREYLTNQTYGTLVEQAIKDEAEVEIDEKDYITKAYTYVYFNINGHYDESYTNWITLTEEEQEQLAVDAQTLADADPDDFNDVANELGQSMLKQTYNSTDLGDENYALDQAVLEAAEKLGNGETSDVIEVEGMGYYVIRMDNVYDEDATAEAVADAEEEQRQAHLDEILNGWKEAITWEVNEEAWAQVTFKDLFEELEHEHEEEAAEDADTAEETDAAEDADTADDTETAADGEDAAADTDSEGADAEDTAAEDAE